MKRFYKQAAVEHREDRFAIVLDGRSVKTPSRQDVFAPTRGLAEAMVEEWNAQGDKIAPHSMPLNKTANTAIDRIPVARDEVIDDMTGYGSTDLLCYRCEFPHELRDIQAQKWQPVLDWMVQRFGSRLEVTAGVLPIAQDKQALAALRAGIAEYSDFHVAALHIATSVTGSVCLALALSERYLEADDIWSRALVDDNFQRERYGQDDEADARIARHGGEFSMAARFLELLRP